MTTIQLSSEISNQLRLISDNSDLMLKVLKYVKGLTAHVTPSRKESESERTRKFLDGVCGKWEDDRSTDEIIADIHAARRNKNDDKILNIFN